MGSRDNQEGSGTSTSTCQGDCTDSCRTSSQAGGIIQSDAGAAPTPAPGTSGSGSGGRAGICAEKGTACQGEPCDCAKAGAHAVVQTLPHCYPAHGPDCGDGDPSSTSHAERHPQREESRQQHLDPRASDAPQQRTRPRGAPQYRPSSFIRASANCHPQWSAPSGRGRQGVIIMTSTSNLQP